MTTASFTTEPFTCPSCVKKIENGVGRLDGVREVSVMFNSNKVKATFDADQITADDIAAKITGLGYPVTRVSNPRKASA